MTGPRVQVTLRPSGKETVGTLVGTAHTHGPSSVLVDGTWPSRLVDACDWEYLPGERPEGSRG